MAFISEKSAEGARLTLLGFLTDEEMEQHDATILCMTAEKLTALYRTVARKVHPDMGGNPNDFVNADRAKCILERYLAQPAPAVQSVEHKKKDCGYCQGKGHVTTSSGRPGAPGLRRTCPQCKGSGDADFDGHNP